MKNKNGTIYSRLIRLSLVLFVIGGLSTQIGCSGDEGEECYYKMITAGRTNVIDSMPVDTKMQLLAGICNGDGSIEDQTNDTDWYSDNSAVGTITDIRPKGVFTAVSPGTVTITAKSWDGEVVEQGLTVTSAILNSVYISTPDNKLAIELTETLPLTAMGVFSDEQQLDLQQVGTQAVKWSVSNKMVAAISETGELTGLSVGKVTVTAEYKGKSATVEIQVQEVQIKLQTLRVTPEITSIKVGEKQQFLAFAVYSDGSTQDITNVGLWGSNNLAVAMVNSTGLVNALSNGMAHISFNFQERIYIINLTVGMPSLSSITLTPAMSNLIKGESKQLSAVAQYSDGRMPSITDQCQWSSSDSAIATVSSGGLVQSINSGTASITCAFEGKSATANIIITEPSLVAISITPPAAQIIRGNTQQLIATANYSNGSVANITASCSWQSSSPGIATVGMNTGLVTGVNTGTATISCTYSGKSSTASVIVGAVTLSSIAIAPRNSTINIIQTQQFTATATYNNGSTSDVTNAATWTSSDTNKATIDITGLATGVRRGDVTITATHNGIVATTTLTVQAPISFIHISDSSLMNIPMDRVEVSKTAPNNTYQFAAEAFYDDGSRAPISGCNFSITPVGMAPVNGASISMGGLATVSSNANVADEYEVTCTYMGMQASNIIWLTVGL